MNWKQPKVYAVKHKDEMTRAASRSGGIFTALSDQVLSNGGVVYGCVLTDEFDAVHIRTDNEEDRNRMRGSKYIQSKLGDTFKSVKEDLDAQKSVLFSGTSCQVAGLKNGDAIEAINKDKVTDWDSLKEALTENTQKFSKGDSLSVTVKRSNGQEEIISVKPQENQGSYFLGVSPALKTSLKDKIFGGFQMAWEGAFKILVALKGLITNFSLNKLGGPVAMFQMSAQASENGLISILNLMGMLSINLGIFNLIPIPALDGGKIVMNIIEAIRRKPLNQEIESYITLAGVAIMVVLMIAVTWNDIMRAFF